MQANPIVIPDSVNQFWKLYPFIKNIYQEDNFHWQYVLNIFSDCKISSASYKIEYDWLSKLSNYSQVFYEKAALMNFIRKQQWGNLFFDNVSRLQAKERLLHRYLPVSFTKYFRTLLLKNTFGSLLLVITLFCSLRHSHKKCFFRPWLF